RPAVGVELARADMVMPALMVEHEEPHGLGLPREQHGIDDEEAVVRNGNSKIGQARVEHVADLAAFERAPGDANAAVCLQRYRRSRAGECAPDPATQCHHRIAGGATPRTHELLPWNPSRPLGAQEAENAAP